MIEAILVGVVAALVLDRFFFPRTHKDKSAREAIRLIGKEINRDIKMYDHIGIVNFFIKDFDKEHEKVQTNIKIGKILGELSKDVDEKIEEVVTGINALAKHLKVELQSYHIPAESGIKIVKIKKTK